MRSWGDDKKRCYNRCKGVVISSFLAHAMVGISLVPEKKNLSFKEMFFVSFFFILLAWSPDIDYLINYLRGEPMPIRYTHSIGYIFLMLLFSLLLRELFFKKYLKHIPILSLFFASSSHLLLDFLVGVHGNPYLYPFSSEVFVAPFGILPSSGRIDIHNYYFWRNMTIEVAIFLPILLLSIKNFRYAILDSKLLQILIGASFVCGIVVGIGLER